ncbi:hypothetical protein VTN02DRAFT_2953 [Thermoascus thermophilus]
MILYARYTITISHRLHTTSRPSSPPGTSPNAKLPVRQNGCVREASGVKKHSIVARCSEGGERVSWATTEGNSATGVHSWDIISARGRGEDDMRRGGGMPCWRETGQGGKLEWPAHTGILHAGWRDGRRTSRVLLSALTGRCQGKKRRIGYRRRPDQVANAPRG